MKIARLYLKAYGHFSNHIIDLDGNIQFHVIFGPNEAGKSTTLRALTGLLFGIPTRTPDDFKHQYKELRVGATLVTHAGTRLSLMRRKATKQTLFAMDENTTKELEPVTQDPLVQLLGGIDEKLYRTLFGLDLEGLTQGGKDLLEGKGEIGQSLFAAAAGLSSLKHLENRLDEHASKLFKPQASTLLINKTIKSLETTRKLARDATVRTSNWEQIDRTRRQKEERHAKARSRLNELRTEFQRLSRISSNLPLIAERADKLLKLENLGPIPHLLPETPQQRVKVEEQLRVARETQKKSHEERIALQTIRAALVVQDSLLTHASRIEQLHHTAKDWRGAMERLPRIENDRTALMTEITRLAKRMTPDLPDHAGIEQIHDLLPSSDKIARIRDLATEYTKLRASEEPLAERARKTSTTLDQLRAELAQRPVPPPMENLEAAREEAAAHGDLVGQLDKANREAETMETKQSQEAAALWRGRLEDLIALPIPMNATLHDFEKHYRQIDNQSLLLKTKQAEISNTIGEQERELRVLAAVGEIATFTQVQTARTEREKKWSLVRQTYIERTTTPDPLNARYGQGDALPTAYEENVRQADRLADVLRADAERIAKHETTRQRIQELQANQQALRAEMDQMTGQKEQLDHRWTTLARSLGQPEITPAAALEWCQKQAAWLDRHGELIRLRRDRQEIANTLNAVRRDFNRALTACGVPGLPDTESLQAALLRAKGVIDAARQAAQERATVMTKITQHESELKEITSQQERLKAKMDTWQNQWTQAMALLRLEPDARPVEADKRIQDLDILATNLAKYTTLSHEVELEQSKRDRFTQEFAVLVAALDPSLADQEPDHALSLLYNDLKKTQAAEQKRVQTDKEISNEEKRIQQAKIDETALLERLAEMMRRAGVSSPDELPAIEQKSAEKIHISARIAEIEEQLIKGTGRPLIDVLTESRGLDMTVITTQLTETESKIREQEDVTEGLYGELNEANRNFQAIDGSEAAAMAEQEAEEILAGLTRQVRTYARTRLAQVIVSRVVQTYQKQHQGPVLSRAGEIFARITLGRFNGLVTDFDNDTQLLLGERPDGTRLGVVGMSQGTRDQLFLALRIATIEQHLRKQENIPLVIDDLLVQFDDERATATLKVLAELAQQTQVLFFTHHGHLCELASQCLEPGSWKRHDLDVAER